MYLGLFRSQSVKAKCGFLSDHEVSHKMDPNKYRKYLQRPDMDQIIVILCTFSVFIFDILTNLLKWPFLKYFGVKM